MNENKDCTYCCINEDNRDYLIADENVEVSVNGDNNLVVNYGYDMSLVEIKFCPICGRKL